MQSFRLNQTRVKYNILRYLAELFVVVFGVYLGFMLNNYSEDLKQQAYIDATIKEMYYSLEKDIKDAEVNRKGHQNGIDAVNYFFKMVKGQTLNIDSFGIHHNTLTRNFVSVQNTSPFETIRSRGFNSIPNDSLRRQMIKLYDFQYEALEKIEEKYQESQLYANESHHINEILDNSLVYNENIKLAKIIIPLDITKEERSRLILILKRIYNTRMFNISLYDEVIGDMENLREHLAIVYPFVTKN